MTIKQIEEKMIREYQIDHLKFEVKELYMFLKRFSKMNKTKIIKIKVEDKKLINEKINQSLDTIEKYENKKRHELIVKLAKINKK